MLQGETEQAFGKMTSGAYSNMIATCNHIHTMRSTSRSTATGRKWLKKMGGKTEESTGRLMEMEVLRDHTASLTSKHPVRAPVIKTYNESST